VGQKKLIRFAAIKTFPNVLEMPKSMQGSWHKHFNNANPITLELACGKGEYTVGLARLYKDRNFIGIDVKGNRIWKGAKTALQDDLQNVAFLRTQIDGINQYFTESEISEIWITFPDPQLRFSKLKKRLTHPKFLRFYQQLLKPDAVINLKTDSPHLYSFTRTVIELFGLTLLADSDNVYAATDINAELQIKTHYEGLDIAGSNRIHYLRFKLDKDLPVEKDSILKELRREQEID
jgi:tRNA (guanine-N7-)-methyltransferase